MASFDYIFNIFILKVDRMGFEPMAFCLQSRRSSTDLPALQRHTIYGKGPAFIQIIVNISFDFWIDMRLWCSDPSFLKNCLIS